MKSLLTLTKFNINRQFKMSFENKKKRNNFIAVLILLGICFLVPIALVCVFVYSMSYLAYQSGELPQFLSVIFLLTQVMIVVFGLMIFVQTIYFSKDNEFLLSLPVKQSDIYLSKFFTVLLSEMIISAVAIIPTTISMAVALSNFGVSVSPLYYLMMVLAIPLMALLPVLLISILSFPLVKIMTFFKKKPFLNTLLSAFLIVGVLCAIYIPLYSSNAFNSTALPENGTETVAIFPAVFAQIGKLSYHTFVYAKAMLGVGNVAANFFIFLGITFAAFAIGVTFSLLFYKSTVRALVEGGGIVSKGKKNKAKSSKINDGINCANKNNNTAHVNIDGTAVDSSCINSQGDSSCDNLNCNTATTKSKWSFSPTFGLVKKEIKAMLRNSQLMTMSIMNILLAPVMIIIMSFAFGKSMAGLEAVPAATINSISKFFFIFFAVIMISGANVMASVAFSREGKQIELLKSYPLSAKDIIRAKLLLADGASFIGNTLCFIVMLILVKLNVIDIIFMLIAPNLLSFSLNGLAVYSDIKKPKFNWISLSEITRKQSKGLIVVLIALITAIVLVAIGAVSTIFIGDANMTLKTKNLQVSAIYWSCFMAIDLIYLYLFRFVVIDKAAYMFQEMEV